MNDSKDQLIKDTLAFLKQGGLLPKRTERHPEPLQPKPIVKPIPRPPSTSPTPPPKEIAAPSPRAAPPKSSPLLLDAIRKHLPHIPLVENLPQMHSVGILFEEEEELPFLTNLKTAIEERFCPCALVDHKTENLSPYTLLLTPTDRNHPEQILLAKASHYRDHIEEKRTLWTTICRKLSQKSS